jgi:hypothetical protein
MNLGLELSMLSHFFLALLLVIDPQQTDGVERVAWLQGCWHTSSPQRIIEEQWTAPRGRSMLGVSRTLRGDSLVGYELVVVRERAGVLTYQAHPSGQASAVFTAQTVSDSLVLFENAVHDFPQRVGYRRVRSDSLLAWIEGSVQGTNRRVEFPYTRARCPGL